MVLQSRDKTDTGVCEEAVKDSCNSNTNKKVKGITLFYLQHNPVFLAFYLLLHFLVEMLDLIIVRRSFSA